MSLASGQRAYSSNSSHGASINQSLDSFCHSELAVQRPGRRLLLLQSPWPIVCMIYCTATLHAREFPRQDHDATELWKPGPGLVQNFRWGCLGSRNPSRPEPGARARGSARGSPLFACEKPPPLPCVRVARVADETPSPGPTDAIIQCKFRHLE